MQWYSFTLNHVWVFWQAMATRFWTPVLLVFLVCMFNHKWNLVGWNHNSNITHTLFSLSVIEERVIRSIWCLASFDSQLQNNFTRWRRYDYSIHPGFISLLLLGGDIELNPGPARNLKAGYLTSLPPWKSMYIQRTLTLSPSQRRIKMKQ